jgi:serine/threonine-protein kinase
VQIGDYEVVSEIGRGGMGTVFLARTPSGAEVAVKVCHRADTGSIARFAREVRLLTGAGPGFVPILATGEGPTGPFLVMPYLTGGTLTDRLKRGPLAVDEALGLIHDVARALGRAHEAGIVHRDLKPDNIIFAADGTAFIADLGLGKHFATDAPGGSKSVSLSKTGTFHGSAGYAPPEQLMSSKLVGPEADVFALGALLYECLTGAKAFLGESMLDTVARTARGKVPPAHKVRAAVPHWVDLVLAKAIAPEPASRYANGTELARALDAGDTGEPRANAPLLVGVAVAIAIALAAVAAAAAYSAARPRPAPPTTPALPAQGRARAEAALGRARAALLAHDTAGALRELSAAIEIDPSFKDAWVARASVHEANDLALATADLTKAIELDPRDAVVWARRGRLHTIGRQFEAAAQDFSHAIELDPKNASYWCFRADARVMTHDIDGAVKDLDRSLELDPGSAVAWATRARAVSENHDVAGALDAYGRSLDLDPSIASTWRDRGDTLVFKGELEKGLQDLDHAIDLDPREGTAYRFRALARLYANRLDDALSDATAAVVLDPEDAHAYAARAIVRQRRGERSEARADLRRGLELAPDDRQLRELAPLIEGAEPPKGP